MELSFKKQLFYFFPVLFCFWMPFGVFALSWMVVLWGVVSFFNIEKKKLIEGFKNKNLWLLYTFFLITLMSAIFSKNKEEAAFSIEIRLGFLFIPYYIFCFDWPAEVIKKSLISFVSGCFFACTYLIIRATIYYFDGHPEYFFYTLFSSLMHPSYFAMYLITGLSIMFLYYPKWFKEHKNAIYLSIVFSIVLIITVFLCESKLGLISFFIIIPVLFIYKWKSLFNIKKTSMLIVGVTVLMFFAIKLFPGSFERLKSITSFSLENVDKTSTESTTVRVLIWEQSLNLIKGNLLYGVNVGDANDALYESYKEYGLTGAFSHKLNAHNQFLQTFIGLGIVGFILMLYLTFGQLIKAFVQKNILLLVFSTLIILNFMVESMLQTSAGTLYFLLFFCLFNLEKSKNEI